MALVQCRECGQQISTEAASCPRCGAPNPTGYAVARQQQVVYVETRRPSGGIAAVLSFLIPGLGQIYRGKVGRGLLWFCGALLGYALLIVPGLIVHLCCIVNAATSD